jgi:hypothetical protein
MLRERVRWCNVVIGAMQVCVTVAMEDTEKISF